MRSPGVSPECKEALHLAELVGVLSPGAAWILRVMLPRRIPLVAINWLGARGEPERAHLRQDESMFSWPLFARIDQYTLLLLAASLSEAGARTSWKVGKVAANI